MSFSGFVSRWIYQFAHIGWGGFLTLLLERHIGSYGVLIILVLAGLKEAVLDPATETKVVQGSGWEDFFFWAVGVGLGFVAWRWL